MKFILVFLALLGGFAQAGSYPEFVPLVVNLSLNVKDYPFYGNAYLFAKDDKKVYFVTNFHVLPDDSLIPYLQIEGPLTANQHLPVQLLGFAPGFDLAIFSADAKGEVMESEEFRRSNVNPPLEPPDAKSDYSPQTGVETLYLGIVGANSGQRLLPMVGTNRSWREELEHYSSWKHFQKWVQSAPLFLENGSLLSQERIPLQVMVDCPTPFLPYCLRASMRSQGFSGSLLFGSPNPNPNLETEGILTLGLVSHYSVFSGDTYIIPMDQVVTTAERLLAKARKSDQAQPIWELTDPSETFEWVSHGELRIIKEGGALPRGSVIALPGNEGFPASSTGFVSAGGGPIAPRPDISNFEKGWLVTNESFALGFFDHQRVLREAKLPEHWGRGANQFLQVLSSNAYLRGSQQYSAHQPGILINREKTFTWNGHEMTRLQNFVNTYLHGENQDFPGYHFSEKKLPSSFTHVPGQRGALIPVNVGKFSSEKIAELSLKPLHCSAEETHVGKLYQQLKSEGVAVPDIMGAHSALTHLVTINRASLTRPQDQWLLQMATGIWGEGKMTFPDKLIEQGNGKWEYRGAVEIKGFLPLRYLKPSKFYGMITINRDFVRKDWELRFLINGEFNERPLPSLVAIDLWGRGSMEGAWLMNLGAYLPLQAGGEGWTANDISTQELEAGVTELGRIIVNRKAEILPLLNAQTERLSVD